MLNNQTKTAGLYLCHHGIKGQKWGVRRYQNEDGSYTSAGRSRYGLPLKEYKSLSRKDRKQVKSAYKIEQKRQQLETSSAKRVSNEKASAQEYKNRINDLKKHGANSEEWKRHIDEVAKGNVDNLYEKLDEREYNTGDNVTLKKTAVEVGAGLLTGAATRRYMRNNEKLMAEHLADLDTKYKEHTQKAKTWEKKHEMIKNFKVDDLKKRDAFMKTMNLGSNTRYNKSRLDSIYNNNDHLTDMSYRYYKKGKWV